MALNRTLYVAFFSLLLSACSSLKQPSLLPPINTNLPSTAQWDIRQTRLQQLNFWHLQGQMGIFTQDTRNSASLNWQQTADNYRINLSGPFGVHLMTIERDNGLTTLTLDDAKKYRHHDTQRLVNELSPVQIPVDELRAWIIGIPLTDDYQLDNFGRVTKAQHPQGWALSYQGYKKIDGIWLPQKINIQKDDIRIKISIKEWTLNAE